MLLRKMCENRRQAGLPAAPGVMRFKRFQEVLLSGRGLISRRLSACRDRQVPHSRVKERLQIRGQHKTRKLLEKVKEGFLQHVEREVLVPNKAVREMHNPLPIAPVQHFKRSLVTAVDGGNEVEVALGFALQTVSPGDACVLQPCGPWMPAAQRRRLYFRFGCSVRQRCQGLRSRDGRSYRKSTRR